MSEHEHGEHGGHGAHDTPYVKIWAILVALLIASIIGPFVGEAMSMQWLTLITAFGIAFVKAFLVIKHFMHVNIEKRIAHYVLLASLICVALFVAGTAGDIMNHRGTNWENEAAQKVVKEGLEAAKNGSHGKDDKHEGNGEQPKKGH